ncbi:hypothetical protein KA093_02820 [Candidatus Saccharibacteria bacterium]|nr:hypothetical protein [Candidatus Saccharibacteria bacterium]
MSFDAFAIAGGLYEERARQIERDLLTLRAGGLVADIGDAPLLIEVIRELHCTYAARRKTRQKPPQPSLAIQGPVALTFYPKTTPRRDIGDEIEKVVFVFPHGLTVLRVDPKTVFLSGDGLGARSLTLQEENGILRYSSPKGFSPNRSAGTRRVGATADAGRS